MNVLCFSSFLATSGAVRRGKTKGYYQVKVVTRSYCIYKALFYHKDNCLVATMHKTTIISGMSNVYKTIACEMKNLDHPSVIRLASL